MTGKQRAFNLASALMVLAAANNGWAEAEAGPGKNIKFSGIWQFEAARTVASPEHTSKLKNAFDLNLRGDFSDNVKWKLGGRFSYDAVYDVNNFYPAAVVHDQRR